MPNRSARRWLIANGWLIFGFHCPFVILFFDFLVYYAQRCGQLTASYIYAQQLSIVSFNINELYLIIVFRVSRSELRDRHRRLPRSSLSERCDLHRRTEFIYVCLPAYLHRDALWSRRRRVRIEVRKNDTQCTYWLLLINLEFNTYRYVWLCSWPSGYNSCLARLPSTVGSMPPQDNYLCDSQTIALSLFVTLCSLFL